MAVVAICTPMGNAVIPEYFRHVMEMQHTALSHTFIYIEVDTEIVGKARTMITETALANNPDVLFWVDSDTLIPPHASVLIEQALELGVVSGVYYSRRQPYTPHVYIKAEEPGLLGMYWPDVSLPETGMWRRDAIGHGCVAVRTDVYHKLREHWNDRIAKASSALAQIDPELADLVEKLSPWYEFLDRKGEDLYFSERLRNIEQDIWVNCDVQCLHMSSIPISKDHFKYLVDKKLIRKVGDGAEMAIPSDPGT